MVPFAVSTVSVPRVLIDFAGVESWTVSPCASVASKAPKPCLQNAAALRSLARAKSNEETCARSFAQMYGPSTNSTVERQSPRSAGIACALGRSALRALSAMARVARTWAVRKSSSSPSRALRRPMRTFWLRGAG